MFDTYNRYHSAAGDSKVHVHNAPTSDQLRLLREVEESIRKEFLGAIQVNDNKFNIVIYLRGPNNMEYHYELIGRFTLNNKEFEIKHHVIERHQSIQDCLREFVSKLSEEIAKQLVIEAIMENKAVFSEVERILSKKYFGDGYK